MSCIFCQIAAGTIPADILHKDDKVIAFRDIRPQAPTHVLIVPVKHIASLSDIRGDDFGLVAYVFDLANDLAHSEGISEKGYRVTVNSGKEGGQVVQHLHFHLLGGRQLSGELG
ncbi:MULTISPECIES: histidine triad nucleotide-binding protein [Dehalogenimonas]|jgi:histidine triad (HIT) family protein|uniref:Diadenosine tetraphosphate (Ap4A) hydrolase or other HIT family hydrolase n=2 Tax=Dehalogenimonas TaxID=670486 RepID=A0A0W0GI39_9CHLR|nr:histidine triad nucleotide-binding protein [Dehalogenimonas alkenigignens]KTB48239.1 Diadenosine tetraphosphate (Ap4A) hydrolase or other HIT family hydrolase [Dehalogenimonas alkenigignens]PVV84474.1 histidine triad nucleotide-binding protein [Dehalogenimonas alkenigignens]